METQLETTQRTYEENKIVQQWEETCERRGNGKIMWNIVENAVVVY